MMPGRQPRRVQRKPRLSRERSTKRFAAGQHRCAFRPETDRFAELFEMLRLHVLCLRDMP